MALLVPLSSTASAETCQAPMAARFQQNDDRVNAALTTPLTAPAAILLLLATYWVVLFKLSGITMSEYGRAAAPFMSSALLLTVAAGTVMTTARQFSRRRSQPWFEGMLWLLTAFLVTAHTFTTYAMFKQILLPERGFIWDPAFAHIGRALFGGVSPWKLTHAVFGSLPGSQFLNSLYSAWLIIIFVYPTIAAGFERDPRRRFQMVASWLLAWIMIGSVAAWYLASAGPIYYNALVGPDDDYHSLQMHLSALASHAERSGAALTTIQFQPILLDLYHQRVFGSVGGISAMPSMHVALATLLALTGFVKGRLLGITLSVYALLIWVGSVHFGWHYLVDGPVAAIMMIVIWKLSGYAATRLVPGSAPATRGIPAVAP